MGGYSNDFGQDVEVTVGDSVVVVVDVEIDVVVVGLDVVVVVEVTDVVVVVDVPKN